MKQLIYVFVWIQNIADQNREVVVHVVVHQDVVNEQLPAIRQWDERLSRDHDQGHLVDHVQIVVLVEDQDHIERDLDHHIHIQEDLKEDRVQDRHQELKRCVVRVQNPGHNQNSSMRN